MYLIFDSNTEEFIVYSDFYHGNFELDGFVYLDDDITVRNMSEVYFAETTLNVFT